MSPKGNPKGHDKERSANDLPGDQKGEALDNCELECDVEDSETDDDNITRMIILSPHADISQSELVQKLHMMELPLTIKATCYGAIIHGKSEVVMEAIKKVRTIDPYNIFTKDRGFPPGDPRRCRGHRGAAREGYHQLEKEFRLLEYVGEALKKPRKVSIEEPQKVPIDTFREIAEENLSHKKSLDKSKTKDEG